MRFLSASGGSNRPSRGGRRILDLGLVLLWIAWLTIGAAASESAPGGVERPTAETVLRRADLVRNPFLGTALEIELSAVSRVSGREFRRTQLTMLTRRGGRTLILMPTRDPGAPGALLIAEDSYWILLPRAERSIELPLRHVVAGDLSHAGFLRFDLRSRYRARHDGGESLGGVPCWRLELEPRSGIVGSSSDGPPATPFGRVRYWVARSGFLPHRIEFYAHGGGLLKTVRFVRYRETAVGRRPARIEIEDAARPEERVILTLGPPRGVPTAGLDFDLDDLEALRAAGRRPAASDDGPVDARRLVWALIEAAGEPGRSP